MKTGWFAVCLVLFSFNAASADESAESINAKLKALNWVGGPTTVYTVGNATLNVPNGYQFLDAQDTAKFDEIIQNPPSTEVTNAVMPSDFRWQAYFSFDAIGYVKDDETIDADAVLASVREGTEASNKVRAERGWPPMEIVGWRYPPAYDKVTKRLYWAIDGRSEGQTVVNFNERILGRKGVTTALLVTDPQNLDTAVREFEATLQGYQFAGGDSYSEFRAGDHVAEIGLTALILGGGAAAVAKSGAAKGLFKFIGVFVLAAFGAIVGFFKKLFGGGKKAQ